MQRLNSAPGALQRENAGVPTLAQTPMRSAAYSQRMQDPSFAAGATQAGINRQGDFMNRMVGRIDRMGLDENLQKELLSKAMAEPDRIAGAHGTTAAQRNGQNEALKAVLGFMGGKDATMAQAYTGLGNSNSQFNTADNQGIQDYAKAIGQQATAGQQQLENTNRQGQWNVANSNAVGDSYVRNTGMSAMGNLLGEGVKGDFGLAQSAQDSTNRIAEGQAASTNRIAEGRAATTDDMAKTAYGWMSPTSQAEAALKSQELADKKYANTMGRLETLVGDPEVAAGFAAQFSPEELTQMGPLVALEQNPEALLRNMTAQSDQKWSPGSIGGFLRPLKNFFGDTIDVSKLQDARFTPGKGGHYITGDDAAFNEVQYDSATSKGRIDLSQMPAAGRSAVFKGINDQNATAEQKRAAAEAKRKAAQQAVEQEATKQGNPGYPGSPYRSMNDLIDVR
jgi:hypothetical protein